MPRFQPPTPCSDSNPQPKSPERTMPRFQPPTLRGAQIPTPNPEGDSGSPQGKEVLRKNLRRTGREVLRKNLRRTGREVLRKILRREGGSTEEPFHILADLPS
ncbi:hypothetical protein M5689_013823 [Euphorbia peplus]|nr:hypothetical protein M5689_013823 [Euphorbia peplus]